MARRSWETGTGWALLAVALILVKFATAWSGMALDGEVTRGQGMWLTHWAVIFFAGFLIFVAIASTLMQPQPARFWTYVATLAIASFCCFLVAMLLPSFSFYGRVARSWMP